MDGITTVAVLGITPILPILIVEHTVHTSQVCVTVGIAEIIVVDALNEELVVLMGIMVLLA
jgi:hypothetical protein